MWQASDRLLWPSLGSLRLAWPLAKRDVLSRYRGSLIGLAWALAAPLGMVAIYSLVFQGVFSARWGNASGVGSGGFGYVMRLFAGLMLFQALAEVSTRATRLMQDNANLVKRVVFPLELLVQGLLLQVALHLGLQAALLTLLLLVFGDGPRLSWLLLPLALGWLLVLQHTLALVFAAVGAYVRDLQHAVPVATTGLMFLSPVFYPIESAPALLQALLLLNPLSAPIELARAAWFGDSANATMLAAHGAVLLLAWPAAHWLFKRLRGGFADLV